MKRLVSWFATNPVATNLLVAFLLLAGIASFTRIPVQIWPDLDVPVISIVVPYLGAAPEEVEAAVCARIDEKLDGIDGIDRVRSTAEEGQCRVVVALLFDADRSAVLADVQNQVNAIDTLPKETETPVVRLVSSSDVVIEVAVTGPTDERTLKELARRVRNDLLSLPAVTRASVANVRPYEISIEVAEASLQRNQLTFDQVAGAIRGNSLDLPGGTIKTAGGELLLRTQGQADHGEEFAKIEVTTRDDGTRVLLKDVARIVDGFADTGQEFRFDGRPAALIRVSQVGSQDLREISAQVRRYVAESGTKYPEDVVLAVWNDQSSLLVDRLATLIDSGLQGLLLVLGAYTRFPRPSETARRNSRCRSPTPAPRLDSRSPTWGGRSGRLSTAKRHSVYSGGRTTCASWFATRPRHGVRSAPCSRCTSARLPASTYRCARWPKPDGDEAHNRSSVSTACAPSASPPRST